MGLFSKPPATVTDPVEDSDSSPTRIDSEKAAIDLQEDINAQPVHHHVHPEAERALVRKLDWRVPPLVAALCMARR